MNTSMLSNDTTNWFYMDRKRFHKLLIDELGLILSKYLIALDFDTAISFMIGETAEEILTKIQQTLSRSICGKIICNDYCTSCILMPSSYAKLTWFVQRLLIMSPLSKPLVKRTFILKNNENCICGKTNLQDSAGVKNDAELNFIENLIETLLNIYFNNEFEIDLVLFLFAAIFLLSITFFLTST